MKKRIISFLLVGAALASFSACVYSAESKLLEIWDIESYVQKIECDGEAVFSKSDILQFRLDENTVPFTTISFSSDKSFRSKRYAGTWKMMDKDTIELTDTESGEVFQFNIEFKDDTLILKNDYSTSIFAKRP